MYPKIDTVSVTTDGSSNSTDYSSVPIRGRIISIQFINVDLTTPTFAITGETTGIGIWSEASIAGSTTRAPTQPAHTQTGGAVTNGYRDICLVNERIKFVTSVGGATKTGSFRITWE